MKLPQLLSPEHQGIPVHPVFGITNNNKIGLNNSKSLVVGATNMSSKVPMDYTEKRKVKKPNGAKPGMVIYENNQTIYITPDQALIDNLTRQE